MAKNEGIAETVEEVAGEQLGVAPWDRPAIFRDAADSATSADLPYWMVLLLSGAIATLGLALNSSAVVIGAMLVAPLLAPVIGLALSLAVGDGRLAVQSGAVVLASTLGVIVVAAALTAILPFHTITLEISARTRPTTLDLAIAVFSGLVGALVTVARGHRLSAAIPGVAISVALIPPLAVAGFGVGSGWEGELIRGSLLLYGANLAGIVLSGMWVFLLVGMHRPPVLEAARAWHERGEPSGLAAWADRARWVRSLGVFSSPLARIGLVIGFVVALGIPLSESLAEIAREARVERAVGSTADGMFNQPGRASILGRQIVYGSDLVQVYLRVATTSFFGQREKERFEREASAMAGEPVHLSLEQLPAGGEDLEQLANLLPAQPPRPVQPPPPPPPAGLGDLVLAARTRLRQVMGALALPDDVGIAGLELATTQGGATALRVAYAAPAPLTAQAQQILVRQLQRALELPALRVSLRHVSTNPRPLVSPTDTLPLRAAADLLAAYDGLRVEVLAPDSVGSAARGALAWLAERGVDDERVSVLQTAPTAPLGVRVLARPAAAAEPQ